MHLTRLGEADKPSRAKASRLCEPENSKFQKKAVEKDYRKIRKRRRKGRRKALKIRRILTEFCFILLLISFYGLLL
jgi:hypothetical protein